MGSLTLALIAAIFLFYIMITAGFWLLAVDMTWQQASFHRRRLLEALYALQGHGTLGADARMVDIFGPLERDASLSTVTRSRIESELKKLVAGIPVLEQLDDADRRERAFAIASWPSISPGTSGLQADTARRDLEHHERSRLESESSIPAAADILKGQEVKGFSLRKSTYAPQQLLEHYLTDSGAGPRRIVESTRHMVPHLREALVGSIDVIGRGTTIGLVTGFFFGFGLDQSPELLLTNVARWSLQMAAAFAVGSILLFSVRLYVAAKREDLKRPLLARFSFVIMIILFIAEITVSFFLGG